jgi:hypothetical protein
VGFQRVNDNLFSGYNSVILNTWQHILITSTDVGITNFYVDGEHSGATNQDAGIPMAGTANTYIGNRDEEDRGFDGQISELKIWNRILTESEINYLYNKEKNKYK